MKAQSNMADGGERRLRGMSTQPKKSTLRGLYLHPTKPDGLFTPSQSPDLYISGYSTISPKVP